MKVHSSRAIPNAVLRKLQLAIMPEDHKESVKEMLPVGKTDVTCQVKCHSSWQIRFISHALLLICILILSGCAYTFVDNDGTKHIIGLAKIDIPPTTKGNLIVGENISVKTIGVSISKIITGGSVSIGYNNDSITTLFSGALILDDNTASHVYSDICKRQNTGGNP